ncbi:glycosyltransferase [Microbacterium sp. NPDC055910]|uniref:glycosyltransferase n=1 Tax=Microbacterium sp. NPDC055910 TaxID=3345659 RepID=UPI0035E0EBEB
MMSIIIPAYNAAETLGRQLEALARQASAPREILVCDNGSTDRTVDVVRTMAERYPEIRLVDASSRRGPGAARNIGVSESGGEWIAFCDADDIVADGWCRAARHALSQHSFAAGRLDIEHLRGKGAFSVSWSPQLDGLSALSYLPGFVSAGSNNMAMHRAVFDSIGGFDESEFTAEDDDFCIRAQLAGYHLTFAPDMLLYVQQRVGLRAVYRQARTYGRGARRMTHKYALLAASTTGLDQHPFEDGAPPEESPGSAKLGRLVRAAGSPARWANLVWRIGWSSGWRRATVEDLHQVGDGTPGA